MIGTAAKALLDAGVSEARVQTGVLRVLALYGYSTWRVGQRDARGTQDPGPSDIIAAHPGDRVLLFVEVKRPGRRKNGQSLAQRAFQHAIEATGAARYILTDDAADFARQLADIRREARAARA